MDRYVMVSQYIPIQTGKINDVSSIASGVSPTIFSINPGPSFNYSDLFQTNWPMSGTWAWAKPSKSHKYSLSSALRLIGFQSSSVIHRKTTGYEWQRRTAIPLYRNTTGYEWQKTKKERIKSQILCICLGQIKTGKLGPILTP